MLILLEFGTVNERWNFDPGKIDYTTMTDNSDQTFIIVKYGGKTLWSFLLNYHVSVYEFSFI